MRSGVKARVIVAGVAAAVAVPLASCAYQPQGMPQNTLSCSAIKAGWVAFYLGGKPLAPGMMHVRSGKVCAWSWPSQSYDGHATTFTNPPIQVTAWDGTTRLYPGDAEYIYSPVPVTLTS